MYQKIIFCVALLIAISHSSPVPDAPLLLSHLPLRHGFPLIDPLRIQPALTRTEIRDDFGQFALSYQTADGQAITEHVALKPSLEGNIPVKQGTVAYTSPEGIPISFSYIADEFGYRPIGSHLPVAPIP